MEVSSRASIALKPEPGNLHCPRCGSTNTKFCYYNNYCLTQPRHFCKSCRRYWTRGGSLRNVPVAGGFRRRKINGFGRGGGGGDNNGGGGGGRGGDNNGGGGGGGSGSGGGDDHGNRDKGNGGGASGNVRDKKIDSTGTTDMVIMWVVKTDTRLVNCNAL